MQIAAILDFSGFLKAEMSPLKKSKYSDAQIMAILKQADNGVPVSDLCREHGMSNANFYKWRSKYGGMDASLMARMK